MDYSNYRTILVLVSGEMPVATIRLNRPEARNAINSQMVSELVDALAKLEEDQAVRCVVLTGNDRGFCAGADIKEMVDRSSVDMMMTDPFRALWETAARFPKPIVAALSGYVLGGGLELAMCCDILIAAEGTRLGQPEINIGIIPGGGGTQRLTRAIGKYRAMEMILSGAMIAVEDAKAYGLVNRIVAPQDCLDEAKKLALEISSKGPLAIRLAKKAINEAQEDGLSDGLEHERQLFYSLFATQDKREGMRAFLEKRRAEFKGR